MTRSEHLIGRAQDRLMTEHRLSLTEATSEQLHSAIADALMEDIAPAWRASEEKRHAGRQACYLSAEYLIGRQVFNNLYASGLLDDTARLLKEKGVDLSALEDVEDAALGNGGLGRLAACYLDSAATHEIALTGYGLRYRYGLFKQSFEEGRQVEAPDDWTRYGDPWSVRRDELSVVVPLKGFSVRAVPYDMPIIGYETRNIGTLRLWQTESLNEFDFHLFSDQEYSRAAAEKNKAEDIVKLLYPNDTRRAGKLMRVKAQYVLSSASLQDMLRLYRAKWGPDYARFSDAFTIQLNDTHPTMAIPELIRLLTEDGVSFDTALEIARASFAYTNHTVMKEALEVWDEKLLAGAAPQLVGIIRQIDRRLRAEHPHMSIIQNGQVHMADLAVYMTRKTNGVARIHSEILKDDVFHDWYTLYPGRFTNVTNGITQRRWLGLCNPELTELIEKTLGTRAFLKDLSLLSGLKEKIDDELADRFIEVKREKKRQLARYIAVREGALLPDHFVFDVQVKRLHEYKRQLMNALSILAIYFELKAGRLPDFEPMAAIFGAKAYPSYARAKAVIRLINQIAALVSGDEDVNERLRVVFVRDYNCSYAERIIPAADISEQISPAGTEASGTGNMKLMLSGAITLGTLDGANVEIVQQAGIENTAIFGATVEELNAIRAGYDPTEFYNRSPLMKKCVDALTDGTFDDPDGALKDLSDSLLVGASWHAADHYFVLKDFEPYLEAKLKLNRAFADKRVIAKMALENIASAGKFSSDRSVMDYARDIWGIFESQYLNSLT